MSRLLCARAVAVLALAGLALAACAATNPAPAAVPIADAAPALEAGAEPSPTVDWFPQPTATPTREVTPLPIPSVVPTLANAFSGPVLLEDQFDIQTAWETFQTASGSAAYGNQVLTLALPGGKASVTSLRSDFTGADFALEISASPSLCRGEDQFGLLLRAASADDGYRYLVTCEGSLRLERLQNAYNAVLQDWTPALGPIGPVRLGVVAVGPEMRFYLNGAEQFSVRDRVFTEGSVGVYARARGDRAVTINFSDLTIRAVEADVGGDDPR